MKLHYDGLNVIFTPETDHDKHMLAGFTNLDGIVDNLSSGLSHDRLFQFNRDSQIDINDGIDYLQAAVANDSLYDEEPPEDDDDDDIPTPVPGSKF